ncbi:MAG: DUF1801 domain-containing protein [Polyangiaceae bacterium]
MDASKLIDQKIASLHDWRASRMKEVRCLIHEVVPDVVEEWKWMGSPVFNRDGILCVLNPHKETVRMTFPKGAKMKDPKRVFNSELEGNARRAILWAEGDALDVEGLRAIVREAVAMNQKKPAARKPGAESSVTGYLPGTKKGPANTSAVKTSTAKRTVAKKAAAKKKVSTKRPSR